MTTKQVPNIKVRRVDFDFTDVKSRHYAGGNIFLTHYINSMHIVFPEGEKFFIRSARAFMDQIKDDPELLDRVKKFIGQEGVHHKEHEKFWDILDMMNLKPRRFAKFYSYTAYNFMERGMRLLAGKKESLLALSVTTALEHFTALLGDGGLDRNHLRNFRKKSACSCAGTRRKNSSTKRFVLTCMKRLVGIIIPGSRGWSYRPSSYGYT